MTCKAIEEGQIHTLKYGIYRGTTLLLEPGASVVIHHVVGADMDRQSVYLVEVPNRTGKQFVIPVSAFYRAIGEGARCV